ncbi:hypothetical protein SI859A1_01529 [Aurantimonas manganoxydans SI85-9A1]|uniref:Uncharacterized protein n=1 Tax=Aurantimonas manganoxydans (strain ATCC BAA-1229 / DSM 21871 / SI85-9A1) TaxID=287752 RepID=Q1YIF1_AURMS|nr:hypothetical protein SI859A1_01529 [Aurantimonas manganoxydans SI85-9A1]
MPAALKAPPEIWSVLLQDVGQKAEEARALDGLGKSPLVLLRHGRDARRHDLATLGNVALQQAHVLVVDLRRIGAGERVGLATAMEGPAGGKLGDIDHLGLLRIGVAGAAGTVVVAVAARAVFAVTTRAVATIATARTIVALLHHGRLAFLVLFHADRHVAQDVFVEAHLALHLLHRRRRGVDVHQRVIRLAVLLDAEGEGLQTPVFHLADLAAIGLENAAELLDELLDLLVRDILAREKYVLVQSHALSPFRFTFAFARVQRLSLNDFRAKPAGSRTIGKASVQERSRAETRETDTFWHLLSTTSTAFRSAPS